MFIIIVVFRLNQFTFTNKMDDEYGQLELQENNYMDTYCHIEEVSFDKFDLNSLKTYSQEDNFHRIYTIRGVRFQFGHIFMRRLFNGEWHHAFNFSVQCLPRLKARTWDCPAKLHVAIYTLDKDNKEVVYFHKENCPSNFGSDCGNITRISYKKLTTEALLKAFPEKKFFARIQIFVEIPTGLHHCYAVNGILQFGDNKLPVNKELLANNSTFFQKLFSDHLISNTNNQTAVYQFSIEHFLGTFEDFKLLYALLEFGKLNDLNEDNVAGVLQLANFYEIKVVESLCMEVVNKKGSKFTLPEKWQILNMTNAGEPAKRSAIKRAKADIGSRPKKFFRGLHAARRLSFEDIEGIQKVLEESNKDL